jgi:4-hydroxy-4-methyl-2-oxoglutarate aldolase
VNDQPIVGLAGASTAVVADALDALGLANQALDPAIRPSYPGAAVVGRAFPIVMAAVEEASPEPYESQVRAIEALRPGDVPVFACDPLTTAAAWGELFSCAARGRGAVGAVVDGYIRDARQIAELVFPTFCRGFSPLDTQGRAEVVEAGVAAVCGGVWIAPGDAVVGDLDGVVAVPQAALAGVVAFVGEKLRSESGARHDLLAGAGIREVWDRYGVL